MNKSSIQSGRIDSAIPWYKRRATWLAIVSLVLAVIGFEDPDLAGRVVQIILSFL